MTLINLNDLSDAFSSQALARACEQIGEDEQLCIRGPTIAGVRHTEELSHFMKDFERTIEYAWFVIATQEHDPSADSNGIAVKRLGDNRASITISRALTKRWTHSTRELANKLSISTNTIHTRRTLVAQVLGRLLFDVRRAQPEVFSNLVVLIGPHPNSDPEDTNGKNSLWISSADFAHYRSRFTGTTPAYFEYAEDNSDAPHFGWSTELSRGQRMWTRNPSQESEHLDQEWHKTRLISFMCYPEFFELDRLSVVYTLENKPEIPTMWDLEQLKLLPKAVLPENHNRTLYTIATQDQYQPMRRFLTSSMFPYMRSKYEEMKYFCSDCSAKFTHLVHISVGVEGPKARPPTSHGLGDDLPSPAYRNYMGVFLTMMVSLLDKNRTCLSPMMDIRIGRLREVLYRSMADELQEEMDSTLKSLEQSRRVLMLSYAPAKDITQRILEAQSQAVKIRRILFDPCHGVFQYGLTGGHLFEHGGRPISINRNITIKTIHDGNTKRQTWTEEEAQHLKVIVHCGILGILGVSHPKPLKRARSIGDFLRISGGLIQHIDKNLHMIEWGAADKRVVVKAYQKFFGISHLKFNDSDKIEDYVKVFKSLKRCLHTQYKEYKKKDRVPTPIGVIAVENDSAMLCVGEQQVTTDEELIHLASPLFPATGDHFPVPSMQYISSLVADIVHFARTSKGASLQQVSISADKNTLSLTFGGKYPVFSAQGNESLEELLRKKVVPDNENSQPRNISRGASFQGNFLGPLTNFADVCADMHPLNHNVREGTGTEVVWKILSKNGNYEFSLVFQPRSLVLKAIPSRSGEITHADE